MNDRLDPADAQAFAERWRLASDAEVDELRATHVAVKFRQLAALMASVASLGWSDGLTEGEAEVRERWRRLRERYHG